MFSWGINTCYCLPSIGEDIVMLVHIISSQSYIVALVSISTATYDNNVIFEYGRNVEVSRTLLVV